MSTRGGALPRWYVDTSAALKLLIEEDESEALAAAIAGANASLAAARLLETELRRAAHRVPELHQDHVTAFLDAVDLYELPPAVFRQAGTLPGQYLRTLDALHLAAAISLDVEMMLTYDHRLAAACHGVGLAVGAPA